MEVKMADKNFKKESNFERLHRWMDAVGGNIALGDCEVKSFEVTKSGDKITLILKKKKLDEKHQGVARASNVA
jgi:hypothetical protein